MTGDIETTILQPATERTTRRDMLASSIVAMWTTIATVLIAPVVRYLFSVSGKRVSDHWIDLADVSKLPARRPMELVFQRSSIDGWKATGEKCSTWVTRRPDAGFVAFSPHCTHLGCAYHWDDSSNVFVCPCHNSRFSINGDVIAGPASRPLDRYEVKVEGNRLLIGDLARTERS